MTVQEFESLAASVISDACQGTIRVSAAVQKLVLALGPALTRPTPPPEKDKPRG